MKLNVRKTIYVGLAFLIICMFWQVYDNVIAKMLINTFGFNQTWSGLIMALDNVLAIFLLPLFGAISDKTRTKWGKRKPFVFVGVILAAVLMAGVALIDSAQQNIINKENIDVPEEYIVVSEIDVYSGENLKSMTQIKMSSGTVYIFNNEYYVTNTLAYAARSEYIMNNITLNNIFYIIAFIGVLLFVLIAMAVYRTPAVSLMPDVTPKPLRSKANAIINLMGTAGGIIALGFMTFLAKDNKPYIWCFIVLAVLMIVLLLVFLWKVNEQKLTDGMLLENKKYGIEEIEEKNEMGEVIREKMTPEMRRSFILILTSVILWFMAYNAATTKFSVYAEQVLQMGYTMPLLIAQATAIVSFIPIGIIASKAGRKKTILVGVCILTLAFVLGIIATSQTKFLIYLTMGIAGIGWATINVNSYPMIVEMSKGSSIGKYTGYYYTASMAAQIATPVLSGILMDLLGMQVLFAYSVVFCVLAFITMLFVKHGDAKPIPVKTIEIFDVED